MRYIAISIFIAFGVVIGTARLIKLVKSWRNPAETASGARGKAWGDLCFGVLPIAIGVSFLGEQAKSNATFWAAVCASFSILCVGLFLTTKSQLQRKRAAAHGGNSGAEAGRHY